MDRLPSCLSCPLSVRLHWSALGFVQRPRSAAWKSSRQSRETRGIPISIPSKTQGAELMKSNHTIEKQSEAFRQHLAASEYLYKEAVAALAVGQAIRHLRPDTPPQPRRSMVRASRHLLGQVCRALRRLVRLATYDSRDRVEAGQQQTQSGSVPIIIDFPIESSNHPAQRFDPHVPWAVVCPPEIQTGDDPSGRSVIGTDNDEP